MTVLEYIVRWCKVNIYNEIHVPNFRDQCIFYINIYVDSVLLQKKNT